MWVFRECVSTHPLTSRSCGDFRSVVFSSFQNNDIYSNCASHTVLKPSGSTVRGNADLHLRLAVPLDDHRSRNRNTICRARGSPPSPSKFQSGHSPSRDSSMPSPSSATSRNTPVRNSSTLPVTNDRVQVGADASLATTPFKYPSTTPMAHDINVTSNHNPNPSSNRRRGGGDPNAHLAALIPASPTTGDAHPGQHPRQRLDGSVPFSSLSGLPPGLVHQLHRHGFTDTTAIQTLALPPLLEGE